MEGLKTSTEFDNAIKDTFEVNYPFQAKLHVASAVNHLELGYSGKEAHDFLHQAICLRLFRTKQTKPVFFQIATQNVSIVKRACRPFPTTLQLLAQFPFVLAANMPSRLILGSDGTIIAHADYNHASFTEDDRYHQFLEWLMQ